MAVYDESGEVDYMASLSQNKPRPGYIADIKQYSFQTPQSVYSTSASPSGAYSSPGGSYCSHCRY